MLRFKLNGGSKSMGIDNLNTSHVEVQEVIIECEAVEAAVFKYISC